MAISTSDRIAVFEIVRRAELDAVARAERSGNCIAAAINSKRLDAATKRLAAAMTAAHN
ncbi:hypothetical protein EDB99_10797 [Pseudomonas sp. 460]|nr:hypothetical protein EDB99_10797 [Pseudomonas sp. 460]